VVTNDLKPSNFREWLWSAKVLTTIVWILFPLGYFAVLFIIYSTIIIILPEFYYQVFGLIRVVEFSAAYTIFIPPIPLMTVLFLFAVFPAIYPSKGVFQKERICKRCHGISVYKENPLCISCFVSDHYNFGVLSV